MKHPAEYTDKFIPIFAEKLKHCANVLDPMAGTGKIALIKKYGFNGIIYCNDIEHEWTDKYKGVDFWSIGDAACMDFDDSFFDAVCTSPTYGNRMADHYKPKDNSKRITYRVYLGHELNKLNTGRMQWGKAYRSTSIKIYKECTRVLKQDGLFILNMSDHIRQWSQVFVTDWHKRVLINAGFECINDEKIKTPRMGFGANSDLRVAHERVLTFILRR